MRNTFYIFLLALTTLAGCRSARVSEPLTLKLGASDADTQLEFWHQLTDRSFTCNDEAFHGLLLYLDGADASNTYTGRLQAMKQRGLLPAGFNEPAEQVVSRGTLAVVITRALHIKGGVMMYVCPSPRYAVRELMYEGIFPASSPNQSFTGTEFLGIVGKLEDWQRGENADVKAADLPTQLPGE